MALNDILFTYLLKNKLRGKDRLYKLLNKLGFRKLILFEAKYGIKLNLNPDEYIDKIIVQEGFYESEITEAILAELKDTDTFWDVGANIGIHSIAVKTMRPGTSVYSFEPNPKTLGLLYENVRLNNLDINICGFALFDKAGVTTLHVAEGNNSGMTTLTPTPTVTYSSTVKCLTTTGDKLISEKFQLPAVIKLDTEGAELNILKGCKNLLADPGLRLIIFEAYYQLLEDSNNDILLLLKEFGFTQVKALIRSEHTHHDLLNFAATRG